FNIDYNEYYQNHIEDLADFLTQTEKAGKTVHQLTPSYIPCLRERYNYRNKEYENPFYPLVSIIMPCYNSGQTIGASVQSVMEQDYPNRELVIVDEASGRPTQKVLGKIGTKEGRVRIIRKDKKNAASARNKGIEAARGQYIAFLDSDDIFYPRSLSLRMEALISDDIDAVFCPTQLLDENLNPLDWRLNENKDFI
ncbi:MAG: glycosyltransferase family 2 protein, partial [bacterium]|nr:glycosyltransferase family 2 protein [bacterium]